MPCQNLDVEGKNTRPSKFGPEGLHLSLFMPHYPVCSLKDGAEAQSGQQLLRGHTASSETQQGQKPSQEAAFIFPAYSLSAS